MQRLFEEHQRRKTWLLDGFWQFVTDPEDRGEAAGFPMQLPENAERMAVPSVWGTTDRYYSYEGAAWYQRTLNVPAPGAYRLVFEAVMTRAAVYFDGAPVGTHDGGFTAFDILLPEVSAGTHTLTVRADNRFDENSIPQAFVDWYHHGGIPRSVWLEQLEGVCILQNHVLYTLNDTLTEAEVCFELLLVNAGQKRRTAPLTVLLDGEPVITEKVTVMPGQTRLYRTQSVTLRSPRLWSPEEPNLVTVTADTGTDDLIDRTGFRKIEVQGQSVLLNGKPFFFKGVCRHEDHPDFGFAFPAGRMMQDVTLLKTMGCNSVRGSHYPNSKLWLDLMDAEGLTFWSEIPIWGCGFSEEDLGRQSIVELGLTMHREMTQQYYNHPSIVIWGMHNEILSNTENAVRMTQLFAQELRASGGNRLITHASRMPLEDACFGFCDILCFNQYVGWYEEDMTCWAKRVQAIRARLQTLGLDGKPLVFSEFGAAAVYGCRSLTRERWTEEYQADLMEQAMTAFTACPAVVGTYPWQFCDMRTSLEAGLTRARSFNNKGLVNEYRKPKQAFFTVEAIYKSL